MKLVKSVLLVGVIGMAGACSNDFGVSDMITDVKDRVTEEEKPDWIIKEGATPSAGHQKDRWTDPDTNCIYARQYIEGATVWTTLGKPQEVQEELCPRHFVIPYTVDESSWDVFKAKMESLKTEPEALNTSDEQTEVIEQDGQ